MSRISLILQFLYMLAYKVEGLDSICIWIQMGFISTVLDEINDFF